MRNLGYVHAPNKDQLWAALKEHSNYQIIAGGTNVMLGILDKKINDKVIVDIRGMEELRGIVDNGETITLGALTTLKDIETSELLEKEAHCLWQAANCFADPTTRNSATVGGNICNASPGADTAPPLLALDAEVVIENAGGKRTVALTDFFKGVGKNCLEAGEIVVAINIKKNPATCFIKLGLRNAMAISVASVAVAKADGKFRVAMGSVAPTPVRCENAEQALATAAEGQLHSALVDALAKDVHPIDDFRATGRYRAMVAPGLVEKAYKSICNCNNGGDK